MRSRIASSSTSQSRAKLGILEDDVRPRPRHDRAASTTSRARAGAHAPIARRGRFARSGLDEQRADAVAIDAEILVAALRDDALRRRRRGSAAQPGRILVEPAAEALVGDVDERDQPALGDDVARPRAHWSSLRSAPVGLWQQPWSRATSPGSPLLERRDHVVEADRAPARARNKDIRPSRARPARMIGAMVGPGRRPDEHARAAGWRVAISSKPSRSAPQPPGV